MLSGSVSGALAAVRAARPAADCSAANRKMPRRSCATTQATDALQRWQTPSNRMSGGWLPGMTGIIRVPVLEARAVSQYPFLGLVFNVAVLWVERTAISRLLPGAK